MLSVHFLIWRVECDGEGIYRAGHGSGAQRADYGPEPSYENHPHPEWDEIDERFMRSGYHCGFAHIAQYKAWFGPKSRNLLAGIDGVKLKAYMVPEPMVEFGGCQVMFHKPSAILVGEFKPNEV